MNHSLVFTHSFAYIADKFTDFYIARVKPLGAAGVCGLYHPMQQHNILIFIQSAPSAPLSYDYQITKKYLLYSGGSETPFCPINSVAYSR
jgi:hypothetical protein